MAYRLARMPQAGRSKYRAVPTTVDGIRFASKREAKRYGELCLLLKRDEIRGLRLQPVYRIFIRPFVRDGVAPGELIQVATYVGDFQYEALDAGRWRRVVEDVKGVKTPMYRLKKKCVEALYGIEIREIS